MATNKKTLSQGNLVDMLAAFGRGALGTLTDRFNQYDAALESVATHEGQIASINRGKTSWANGGTITSETYYNILKGTQGSFTLPFDLNGFVSGITANGNAQRYSGVTIAVSYANKPGQPKQRSDTLYLPFAAVNAEKGVVAFEDLQFHYTDLAGTDVDVRYKVTPVSGSQIKLEKVEESANKPDTPTAAAKPFTFYLNGDVLGYNPDDYANGINFNLQIPATISTNLNTCCKQYLERTSNAASTATSITSEDPGTKLPQFYLLFGKGNSAFRFQCDGVHQSGSALYFHGEIRNTSNYAYYDAYWMQGGSYIVFRKVLNIYFASGGAAS